MHGVFRLLQLIKDLSSFCTIDVITHLMNYFKLFGTFLQSICYFQGALPSEIVNDLAFGLSNHHLGHFMLFNVVPWVVVKLLKQVVIYKDCTIDFIDSILSCLTVS